MRHGGVFGSLKFRAFVSVVIHPNATLEALLDDLSSSNAGLKVVKPTNLHVTLKFLGDTEESLTSDITRMMEEAANDISPFEVRLRGMGAFPSLSNMRVIWVGIENGKELATLAERLDSSFASLGIRREKRAFRPHLTVARSRGGDGAGNVQSIIATNTATDYGDYIIDRVALMKSVLTPKGPIYSDVKVVRLVNSRDA